MFSLQVDTKDFDAVFADYMKFQKRLPADVVNAKLYYIARNCTSLTKTANSGRIRDELSVGSDRYPDAPLAAILVNKQLGKQNQKGLTGSKMARAVEKFIKNRIAHRNFIRSGWKNAIVIIEKYLRSKGELNFVKRWSSTAPADKATMNKKNFEKLGKATPALVERSPRAYGEIQNDIGGPDGERNSAILAKIKVDGLNAAIRKETASMITYLERKLNPVNREYSRKLGGS